LFTDCATVQKNARLKPSLGTVHKRRSQSGGGSSADILRTRRVLQRRASVRTKGGRGWSQYGHFADKGRGINFSRFCLDVFYGRPLIKKI